MAEPVITAAGIAKAYGSGPQTVVALNPVDFSVQAGEFVMLSGPSGSGKSTLLAIVSGLLRPDEGRVNILGQDLGGFTRDGFDAFRLRHFGFIFQGFHLLPYLTALEQVAILLERQGSKPRAARDLAAASLAEVGLGRRLDSRPSELSGGEKQRVAVARALAKRADIIFADEPTSALDSTNGAMVTALLRRAADVQGAAVVCVTHDIRLHPHANRLITMEDGSIQPGRGSLTP
jgi:putative ABC transport system ATP-binding protein